MKEGYALLGLLEKVEEGSLLSVWIQSVRDETYLLRRAVKAVQEDEPSLSRAAVLQEVSRFGWCGSYSPPPGFDEGAYNDYVFGQIEEDEFLERSRIFIEKRT